MRRLGLKHSAFDELRRTAGFPQPIFITARCPGWLERELDAYIETHVAKRDDQTKRGVSHVRA